MFRAIYLAFLFFLTGEKNNQDTNLIKKYVQEQSIEIKATEDGLKQATFSNLEQIAKVVRNTRILMIGEQDHGDGTSISSKVALIKYLHENYGFSILLFESDVYALNYSHQTVEMIQNSIFPIWSECEEFGQLFNYLKTCDSNRHPLKVSGFDIQFNSDFSELKFKNDYLKKLASIRVNVPINVMQIVDTVVNSIRTNYSLTKESIKTLISFDRKAVNILARKGAQDFWIELINSLDARARQISSPALDMDTLINIREKQMAKNLVWLIKNKYKNAKVIVWSANAHVAKNTSKNFEPNYGSYTSMAEYVTQSINKDSIYNLVYTCRNGKYGNVFSPVMTVPEVNFDGFETWINGNYNYAFTDFKKFRSSNPGISPMFYMSNPDHANVKARWVNIYDGVFYIKEMAPCEKANIIK